MSKIKYFIVFLIVGICASAVFYQVKADVDTILPSAISDLAVSTTTQSSVTLTWTAPGDDLAVGTSTSYDLRYSAGVISSSTWASATQAIGEPTPKLAGNNESMIVSGLASSTTYYFAIKAKDEAGNESEISNVANGRTLAPPIVTPPAVDNAFDLKVAPRTLNLSSQGNWIDVTLYLASSYKASEIDMSSLLLNGTIKPDSSFKGVNRFEKGRGDEGGKSSNLSLKFSRLAVQALAGSGDTLALTLTGTVAGKTFSASDTIKILRVVDLDDDGDDDTATSSNGTLIQSTSSPDVYIIINGHKRHIPSSQAFARLGLMWQNIKRVSQEIIDALPDDVLMRASNSPAVYVIINGTKRHIPNAEVFCSYGFSWDDVTIVNPSDLADYSDASLIRPAGDSRVYLLSGGQKHWIPSLDVFNKRGFNWLAVIIVNATEASAIPTGGNAQ